MPTVSKNELSYSIAAVLKCPGKKLSCILKNPISKNDQKRYLKESISGKLESELQIILSLVIFLFSYFPKWSRKHYNTVEGKVQIIFLCNPQKLGAS